MDKKTITEKAESFLGIENIKDVNEVLELIEQAASQDMFYYARNLLQRVFAHKDYTPDIRDRQNMAMYYYKDTSLSSDYKFDKALTYLGDDAKNVNEIVNCDTAGILGSIYKRKWYFNRDILNLRISQKFYEKGYEIWCENELHYDAYFIQKNDFGYAADSLAYINIQLALEKASLRQKINADCTIAEITNLLHEADAIWKKIVASMYDASEAKLKKELLNWFEEKQNDTKIKASELPDLQFLYATVIEALLGLRQYDEVKKVLPEYLLYAQSSNWKKRTTVEQIHFLIGVQQKLVAINPILCPGFDAASFTACLNTIYNKPSKANYPDNQSKTGLALSGGGFRASYFHIGVLAALAENGKLKDIEVISCVSGGSILGAYYYLKVKKILETNAEHQLDDSDYVDVVEQMITDFHKGVQNNLRVRWFTNFFTNLKIATLSNYSRTNRMAELYDFYFYGNRKIPLRETTVSLSNFDIHNNNYERLFKVPQLILNTTALNTGHNFQFASTWMGESPILINRETDPKKRLRRIYYYFIENKTYRDYPLCNAVGASSCVPALFIGLVLKDLYEGVELKLVDGGVHDNQGLAALMENECKHIYISDASGQLQSEEYSVVSPITELFRSTNVSAEHIRDIQLNDQLLKHKENFYDSLHLMHLKKDINEGDVHVKGTKYANRAYNPSAQYKITSYGVSKDLQESISKIRTDLDSFTDAEAYSLMYSGYLQTINSLDQHTVKADRDWKFKCMNKEFESPDNLIQELNVSSGMTFKWWPLLNTKFKSTALSVKIILITLVALLLYFGFKNFSLSNYVCAFLENTYKVSLNLGTFVWSPSTKIVILLLFLLEFFGRKLFKRIGFKSTPVRMAINFCLLTLAFIFSWVYLLTFSRLYNYMGARR